MQKVILEKQLFSLVLGLTVAFGSVGASAETLTAGLMELVNHSEYSPQLLTSGQPAWDQFPAIKAADVDAIINLAPVTAPPQRWPTRMRSSEGWASPAHTFRLNRILRFPEAHRNDRLSVQRTCACA